MAPEFKEKQQEVAPAPLPSHQPARIITHPSRPTAINLRADHQALPSLRARPAHCVRTTRSAPHPKPFLPAPQQDSCSINRNFFRLFVPYSTCLILRPAVAHAGMVEQNSRTHDQQQYHACQCATQVTTRASRAHLHSQHALFHISQSLSLLMFHSQSPSCFTLRLSTSSTPSPLAALHPPFTASNRGASNCVPGCPHS